MSSPQTIVDDQRPIKSVTEDHEYVFMIGQHGVTKIVSYYEMGEYCKLPYFAIYKGDFIIERIPASGRGVVYLEENKINE